MSDVDIELSLLLSSYQDLEMSLVLRKQFKKTSQVSCRTMYSVRESFFSSSTESSSLVPTYLLTSLYKNPRPSPVRFLSSQKLFRSRSDSLAYLPRATNLCSDCLSYFISPRKYLMEVSPGKIRSIW